MVVVAAGCNRYGHLDRDGASGLAFEDGVAWLGSGDIESGKGALTKITP